MQTEDKLIPYHAADLTGKRVLVLAPHPDDETIGCGGSLIRHTEAGDAVKVIFLTNGAQGDVSGKMDRAAYVELRMNEARKACACLGVTDLEFWGYEDRSLAGSRGALRRLMDLLESFRPELVYAPSPVEVHPDHRAASFLLYDAVCGSKLEFEIAFYEIGQPMSINLLVDTSEVLGRRVSALETYESQLKERPYKDVSIALNRYRSITLPPPATHAEGYFLCGASILRQLGLLSVPFQRPQRLAPDPGEVGPLVSVIVRTKDRPALLANALKSITQQTYANIEVVVVNDGGADVKDIVDAVTGGGIPVAYIAHETNEGRSAAANSGLRAARGLYVNFLDDDDVLYPDHVETLVRAILLKGEKVAYSGVSNAYYEGPPQDPGNCVRKETIFNQPFDPDLFLFASHIPIMSVLFHRDVFNAIDGFCLDLDLFEDWEFLIRASRQFGFRHVDKVTAEYRFYGVADTEASHRDKYAYDQAQADLFDRVVPYLTGEGWIRFLESELPYALGRNKKALERRMDPLNAQLKETADALGDLQSRYRTLEEDYGRTSASLDQAIADVNALQTRNDQLESVLNGIISSKGWAWLARLRYIKSRLKIGGSH